MPVTAAQLQKDFLHLGLPNNCPIMVHASLRKTGPLQGGAETLIGALLTHIGPQGTLIMPLGADDELPFDALTSPAEASIGVLAEVFRCYSGVQVNDHVAARFAAIGPQSHYLLHPVPLHDYYGPGSILERFSDAGGWVFRLGADPNTITLAHWAEYLAVLPHKRRVTRYYQRADGRKEIVESLDDSEGIVDWAKGDYFSQIWLDFFAEGKAMQGWVGNAQSECFSAADFVPFAVHWIEKNLA
jgi:aminoglycoside N3'-acetyltransferase